LPAALGTIGQEASDRAGLAHGKPRPKEDEAGIVADGRMITLAVLSAIRLARPADELPFGRKAIEKLERTKKEKKKKKT